jgi:hypothetical protein
MINALRGEPDVMVASLLFMYSIRPEGHDRSGRQSKTCSRSRGRESRTPLDVLAVGFRREERTMFTRNRDYKSQVADKAEEATDVLSHGLQDLTRQAGKQAKAVERRFRKPKPRHRLLKVIGFSALLIAPAAALLYYLKSKSQAETEWADPYRGRHDAPPATASVAGSAEETRGSVNLQAAATSQRVDDFESLVGKEVFDLNGKKVGEATGVYYRARAGDAEWIIVRTGLLETEDRPAPLDGAQIGEDIRLACPEDLVKVAPSQLDDVLDVDAELQLYGHYSVRRTQPDEVGPLENDPLRRWISASQDETTVARLHRADRAG